MRTQLITINPISSVAELVLVQLDRVMPQKCSGLTRFEIRALLIVSNRTRGWQQTGKSVSYKELKLLTGDSDQMLSTVLKSLKEKGLISKLTDEIDRRVTRYVATELGNDHIDSVERMIKESLGEWLLAR